MPQAERGKLPACRGSQGAGDATLGVSCVRSGSHASAAEAGESEPTVRVLLLFGLQHARACLLQGHRVGGRPCDPLELVVLDLAACLFSHLLPEVSKPPAEHGVVRPLVEVHSAAVGEVLLEGGGEAGAQVPHVRSCFLVPHLPESVLGVPGRQAGPGKGAAQEVHEHVADRLQVVPPALRDAAHGVDRGVAHRARERTVLHGHVSAPSEVLLGEAEVDEVDVVLPALGAGHDVIRLDVAVHEARGVEVLHAAEHLLSQQDRGHDVELPAAALEPILEATLEEVRDHAAHAVRRAHEVQAHEALALAALHLAEHGRLARQHAGADGLELQGDLRAGPLVDAAVHGAEAARAEQLAHLEAAAGDRPRH
mmetsp:Transcript_86197/g.221993  ORF Transcript_86197/g.221993 Transcript_86197/m.221993 type:complete len:367 (+) Transcript_86197:463-1563(+)